MVCNELTQIIQKSLARVTITRELSKVAAMLSMYALEVGGLIGTRAVGEDNVESFARATEQGARYPTAQIGGIAGTLRDVDGCVTGSDPKCSAKLMPTKVFMLVMGNKGATAVSGSEPFFQLSMVRETRPVKVCFTSSEYVKVMQSQKGFYFQNFGVIKLKSWKASNVTKADSKGGVSFDWRKVVTRW